MYGEIKVEETIKHPKVAKRTKHESSESDQFELQYHQIKKLGLTVNKKKLRIGNWAPEENLIYLKFLQDNKLDFVSEQQRRKNKVFYRLSKILKKRTPDQCRSHHQKLQMKYEDNIEQIIQSIKRKLEKKSHQVYEDGLKKIDISTKKTAVIDTYQDQNQDPVVVDQGQFYKFTQNAQKQLTLQILLDHIKPWP